MPPMKPHLHGRIYNTTKLILLAAIALLLPIIPIYLYDNPYLLPDLSENNPSSFTFVSDNLLPSPSSSGTNNSNETKATTEKTEKPDDDDDDDYDPDDLLETTLRRSCNVFKGEWVPFPEGPYYTNETCGEIYDHQNCLKFGRPDTGFMKWRWKPSDCELKRFNPVWFFKIVRGKTMAFIGDSLARNQMQSLVCLLSHVPVEATYLPNGKGKRFLYTDYNFTIIFFWSPHLVKTTEDRSKGPVPFPLVNLFVDEFDDAWTTQVHMLDYVIISAAQWFWRPSMFYENGRRIGCFACNNKRVRDLTLFYGYSRAFRTAFRAIYGDKNFNGITFLRTYSPGHFDNGAWNEGGTCTRTKPFRSNEKKLEGHERDFYSTQLQEYRTAESEGMKRGLKFRLLDTTHAMLLRPDGHPGPYGHPPEEHRTISDCVHWCLPGPTDTWNELLLHLLKLERSSV
ncbi:hypothetical protein NE237_006435 [Protea cynaroides]|uniref:Trichome birefringence-like N-terminal domain-containing protein n=1 Tax=Protea cynaroides TaxID=273540 RepID=A0A9Q0KN44_9MAGN|nr:hypothetical protein NE237_006435 [Protea cynaroides]